MQTFDSFFTLLICFGCVFSWVFIALLTEFDTSISKDSDFEKGSLTDKRSQDEVPSPPFPDNRLENIEWFVQVKP